VRIKDIAVKNGLATDGDVLIETLLTTLVEKEEEQ